MQVHSFREAPTRRHALVCCMGGEHSDQDEKPEAVTLAIDVDPVAMPMTATLMILDLIDLGMIERVVVSR